MNDLYLLVFLLAVFSLLFCSLIVFDLRGRK